MTDTTCPQCGLGDNVAHGRFVCAYRAALRRERWLHEFKRSYCSLGRKRALRDVQDYARVVPIAVEESDQTNALRWWCVRNAWRFWIGELESGMARHHAEIALERSRAEGGAYARASADVARYAAARYAQACAEIVTTR